MHIKTVIVQGFKSYKNKTVVNFVPGLNVIVGHNGAGKSNLFYAIQFVLAHEFQHLSAKKLAEMLHSSGGDKVSSGFVEIIFNNQDGSLPDGKEMVSIRREITNTKDVYLLDGKPISREQVIKTLQSAGISVDNPYYVIGQGKVRELSTASAVKRLAMLKEISGTSVWSEKKPIDGSLLQEAEGNIAQLDHFKMKTQNDIEELNQEQQQYNAYLEYEVRKRVLESLLLNNERSRQKEKLHHLEQTTAKCLMDVEVACDQLTDYKRRLAEWRDKADERQHQLDRAQWELDEKVKVLQELKADGSRLELMRVADDRLADMGDIETMRLELQTLDDDIAAKRADLDEASAARIRAEVEASTRNLNALLSEQRRQFLFSKSGRQVQFSSREDRDEWIRLEIADLERAVRDKQKQLDELPAKVAGTRQKIQHFETCLQQAEMEEHELQDSLRINKETRTTVCRLVDSRRRAREHVQREKRRIELDVESARDAHKKALRSLAKAVSKDLVDGLQSVRTVIEEMRKEGGKSEAMADEYYGLVVDQIGNLDVEPIISVAINAVAKNRLFHHVVKSVRVGLEIVRRINVGKLPGIVNLFPLDTVTVKERVQVEPTCHHAQLSANLLVYVLKETTIANRSSKVFEHLFGRVLLCRDFDTACDISNSKRVVCVTAEGDVLRPGGPVCGGHHAEDHDRLALYATRQSALLAEDQLLRQLADVSQRLQQCDQETNEAHSELMRVEAKIERQTSHLNAVQSSSSDHRASLTATARSVRWFEARTIELESSLNAACEKIRKLNVELGQDLVSDLSPEERDELEELNRTVDEDHRQFKVADHLRQSTELRAKNLDVQVAILLRQREDLERRISDSEAVRSAVRIAEGVDEKIQANRNRVAETEADIGRLQTTFDELAASVVNGRAVVDKLERQVERKQNDLDQVQQLSGIRHEEENALRSRIALLESRIEACGSFADPNARDLMQGYSGLSIKRLERELGRVNQYVKDNHVDVNLKAAIETEVNRQRMDELNVKLSRAREGNQACRDVIADVDSKSTDAVQQSLMTVKANFKRIFGNIASPGWARLKWTYADGPEEDDNEPPRLDRLTGVDIQVSFSGQSQIRNLSSLSGGQQSIVSLCVVFAILMMDRAPFYLMDEADMALDVAFRKMIASTIDKFARRSQFIVTTFRPELLDYAQNIVGVRYGANQMSWVGRVSKDEAARFVSEDEQRDASPRP